MIFKKFKKQKPIEEPAIPMENNAKTTSDRLKVYNLIILDKSGSMGSIADAAISGFNETVGGIRSAQQQFRDTQEHYVSLFVFCDCDKHYIYENVPVNEVKTLTSKEYQPCCCTPLYDAMGISLNQLLHKIQTDKNATAAVTVITDGMENASHEYSGASIKALVDKLKEQEGWNFAYIGTNQDVDAVAADLSISNTMYFNDDKEGMVKAWENERKAKRAMFSRMNEDACVSAHMAISEIKSYRAKRNREERNYRHLDEFRDRITPKGIHDLQPGEIFVFGSNLEGMHGGGAARTAMERFGAMIGQGVGLQGQSYAIPTMQGGVETIRPYVDEFLRFADCHRELTFLVTRIGCGIAGFRDEEIAPLFARAIHLPNIHLPLSFWKELVQYDD